MGQQCPQPLRCPQHAHPGVAALCSLACCAEATAAAGMRPCHKLSDVWPACTVSFRGGCNAAALGNCRTVWAEQALPLCLSEDKKCFVWLLCVTALCLCMGFMVTGDQCAVPPGPRSLNLIWAETQMMRVRGKGASHVHTRCVLKLDGLVSTCTDGGCKVFLCPGAVRPRAGLADCVMRLEQWL